MSFPPGADCEGHPLTRNQWKHLAIQILRRSCQAAVIVWMIGVGYLSLALEPSQISQERMLLMGKWAIPAMFVVYVAASLVVILVRFVTAPSALRKQIQWIMYGAVLAGLLTMGFSFSRWNTAPAAWLLESSEYLLPIYAILALTIAFSFMEFRLIDVDRIVHRSLVYAVLSGVIIVVYFALAGGLGLLLTQVFDTTSNMVTVLATIVSAAAVSSTCHRLATTLRVPEYMNARAIVCSPAPARSLPAAVSHADRTTRSASRSSCNASAIVK